MRALLAGLLLVLVPTAGATPACVDTADAHACADAAPAPLGLTTTRVDATHHDATAGSTHACIEQGEYAVVAIVHIWETCSVEHEDTTTGRTSACSAGYVVTILAYAYTPSSSCFAHEDAVTGNTTACADPWALFALGAALAGGDACLAHADGTTGTTSACLDVMSYLVLQGGAGCLVHESAATGPMAASWTILGAGAGFRNLGLGVVDVETAPAEVHAFSYADSATGIWNTGEGAVSARAGDESRSASWRAETWPLTPAEDQVVACVALDDAKTCPA